MLTSPVEPQPAPAAGGARILQAPPLASNLFRNYG